MALRHPDEYPMCDGRLATTGGLDVAQDAFPHHVVEEQVPHSTALHARRVDAAVVPATGPLARWNLNAAVLPPAARAVAREVGLPLPCTNPALGIVVRAVEMVCAVEEAQRLVAAYEPPPEPAVPWVPRAGIGHAVTEAPRGLLYHRYVLDPDGTIAEAVIVPPTSQNQGAIEHDLLALAPSLLDLPHEAAALEAEKAIRHWDPCISCATHFLRLRVEETP
jgi:coenzyme F420-reducing hydrogenase alpha subunit